LTTSIGYNRDYLPLRSTEDFASSARLAVRRRTCFFPRPSAIVRRGVQILFEFTPRQVSPL